MIELSRILVPAALLLRIVFVAVEPDLRPPSKPLPSEPPAVAAGDSLPRFGESVPVDVPPEVVTRVPPLYPEEASRAGITGTVLVQALVGKDGLVKATRVVQSIPALDAAAEAAIRQWIFKPARADDKPVAIWVAIPVRFSRGPAATVSAQAFFDQSLAEFRRAPVRPPCEEDALLRERIIRLALELRPAPEPGEAATRHFGLAMQAKEDRDTTAGAARALEELSAALHEAPWWAQPYYDIAGALEAAGRPAEAAVALDLYLVADPRTSRWEEVRRRLAALRAPAARRPPPR